MANFNDLPLPDKALILAEYGTYLDSMQWYDYHVHLHSMNHHFVEIYCNIWTRRIDNIVMIKYKDLDRYMDRIVLVNIKTTK